MSDEPFDLDGVVSRSNKTGPSLKARAVRLLSMREHTRQELARKLAPHAADDDALQAVLDDLERQGWQSDERFVQSFEDSRLHRYGARRIASHMREKGVNEALVQQSLDRLKSTELARAWEVWERRFGQTGLPVDPKVYAKQARFLAARGFDGSIVNKILSGRYQPENVDSSD